MKTRNSFSPARPSGTVRRPLAALKRLAPLAMALLTFTTSCEQDDTLDPAPQDITLTTPMLRLSGVQAGTRAATDGSSLEEVASSADITLYLHDSDKRENTGRNGYYYSNFDGNGWTADPSVTVSGGEGHYRAGIWGVIDLNPVGSKGEDGYMPEIANAHYGYRGSIDVKADGSFTPDGPLQPASAAVHFRLKDADGADIAPNGTYLIKPVGLAWMWGFVEDENRQSFPNGTEPPVPGANTWSSFPLSSYAYGDYTPGTYPATWTEYGPLKTLDTAPTAPWPLFEVTYCSAGFVFDTNERTYVPQGTATTWTVSYPAQQLTLAPGKLYTFTATLGANAAITLDATAVNISDWTLGETINVGK